jgi:hypothetical protein
LDQTAQELDTNEVSSEVSAPSFLSLGNSIAFGYNPFNPTPNVPSSFIGYPEVIASKGYKVTNTSCPGETSSSFFSTTEPDNGCRQFKSLFSLHADYETTQAVYVLNLPKRSSYTFITLDIGANDLFLLQKDCLGDTACIQARLPTVLATYTQNLNKGYNQLKAAGYTGKFIGLTTYALNYNDPLTVGALTALNGELEKFTTQIKGKLADGFAAFKTKAFEKGGGDACAAGLLIKVPDGGVACDIHPSKDGRELLATTILKAAGLIK